MFLLKDYIEQILCGSDDTRGKFFKVSDASQLLKDNGIAGGIQRFARLPWGSQVAGGIITIKSGVITRHRGKDADHNFTADEWRTICASINTPCIITKNKERGDFNLYLDMIKNDKRVLVGLEVRSVGRGTKIDAIKTVFAKNFNEKGSSHEVLYKKIRP